MDFCTAPVGACHRCSRGPRTSHSRTCSSRSAAPPAPARRAGWARCRSRGCCSRCPRPRARMARLARSEVRARAREGDRAKRDARRRAARRSDACLDRRAVDHIGHRDAAGVQRVGLRLPDIARTLHADDSMSKLAAPCVTSRIRPCGASAPSSACATKAARAASRADDQTTAAAVHAAGRPRSNRRRPERPRRSSKCLAACQQPPGVGAAVPPCTRIWCGR